MVTKKHNYTINALYNAAAVPIGCLSVSGLQRPPADPSTRGREAARAVPPLATVAAALGQRRAEMKEAAAVATAVRDTSYTAASMLLCDAAV